MNKPKQIPEFKSEAEEREFWETHNSTDYVNWEQAKPVIFANLKPSTKAISLRMPQAMLEKIKVEANRRDVPYQSLIKVWLGEHLDRAA
jgi:predicted DNA binding CopG/RHH family protein